MSHFGTDSSSPYNFGTPYHAKTPSPYYTDYTMPGIQSEGWFPIIVSVIPYIRRGEQYPAYNQVNTAARANTSIELHLDMTYEEVKAKIYDALLQEEPVKDFLIYWAKTETLPREGLEVAVRQFEINVLNCRSMLLGLKSLKFGEVIIEVQLYPDEPEMPSVALDPNLEPYGVQRGRTDTEYSTVPSWEIQDLQRLVDQFEHVEHQASESSREHSIEYTGGTEVPWVEMSEASDTEDDSFEYEEEERLRLRDGC